MLFIPDLKTVPPGFKNGMNFGSSDVNLNLASSLKQLKSKPNNHEDSSDLIVESDSTSVIDLADLLKEKGSIFKWIEEEPLLSKKNNFGDLIPFIFVS